MCIRDRPYVAEKMGVTASTILRYENGSIDNTKKMVLEGLSEAEVYQNQSFYLHLSSLHCLFLSFHKYLSLLYKIYNIHTAYRR